MEFTLNTAGALLPPGIIFAWGVREFLRPMGGSDFGVSFSIIPETIDAQLRAETIDKIERGEIPGPPPLVPLTSAQATQVIVNRFSVLVTPFSMMLGLMYQGLAGLTAGFVASMLAPALGLMSAHVVIKPKRMAEPFPGQDVYYVLDNLDALLLASFVPTLLITLRSQGVEKGGFP